MIENENVNLKDRYQGTDGQIGVLPSEGPGRYHQTYSLKRQINRQYL